MHTTCNAPVRVKICGITRAQDAQRAAEIGADALGLVFFADSKRCVTIENAQQIAAQVAPFVSLVGLFVNANKADIQRVLQAVPLNLLQFHGDETPEFCEQFHRPYLKAVRVQVAYDITTAQAKYTKAQALLFDAYHPLQYGGTGNTFNWDLVPKNLAKPWVLAGGLNAHNVADAIRLTGAAAVDVSGGVEATYGIKDAQKMADFIRCAKTALLT